MSPNTQYKIIEGCKVAALTALFAFGLYAAATMLLAVLGEFKAMRVVFAGAVTSIAIAGGAELVRRWVTRHVG